MDNYGVIIRHLRAQSRLSVRKTASLFGKSIGWLSEIENGTGTARISETEFNRVVELLGGGKQRALFKTWVANHRNKERVDKTFDGAVLKYIRIKKGFSLRQASKLTGFSCSFLSKIETGVKTVTVEMRNQIMIAYGYSATSFKNLSTDSIRSQAVPDFYKLQILLRKLSQEQIRLVFQYAQEVTIAQ